MPSISASATRPRRLTASGRRTYLCPSGRALLVILALSCLDQGFGAGRAVGDMETPPDSTLDARRKDLADVENRVEAIGRELVGREADRAALIAELEAREQNVAELALANRELERLVAEHTRVARELRARQAEERQALKLELRLLSELIRTAYVMGRADRLRLLLNQEDPTRASRVMSYFAYLNRERLSRIQSVRDLVVRLAVLARDAEEEAGRLAELAKSQEATRARLETAKARRAQVLDQLEETIASRAETLEALKKDAESLRLLIEHLRQREQIRAELSIQRDPFGSLKGRLAWPILERRIVAGFGSAKDDSRMRWDGVLLAAHEGEEVRAINGGRVVYADWLRGFGLLLVIDHGDGFMTLYGHNEALLREVGEWVSRGDPIALTGNSGGREDPVLYFAIRHNGHPLDPKQWCKG